MKKVPCLICNKLKESKNPKEIAIICDDCGKFPEINPFLKKFDSVMLKTILEKANNPEHVGMEVNEYGEII